MTQTSVPSSEPAGLGEQNNPVQAAQPAESDELSEIARLEALLFARTRSHGSLQRELERKERLIREALSRMSTSTSQEFSALRAGYDAAVARAIEAEVARAELTFALDETRAQLTAAAVDMGAGVGTQKQAPGVYAGGVEPRSGGPEAAPSAPVSNDSALRECVETLRGEVAGLRARVLEAETAWQSAHALSSKLQQRIGSSQTRVDELRSESAELKLLAETRAARIAELTHASGVDQQELRALRAQVATATEAQVAQNEAREADRQLWSQRFSQQEEREQAAWKAASEAVARSESRLREFLVSLEQPLQELDGALDALNTTQAPAQEQRAPKKASGRASKARAQQAEEPATAPRLKNNSAEE